MDQEKKKLVKFFESKGIDKEELEEVGATIDKPTKRKLHQVEKISNLKEMINRSGELYKNESAFKLKTDKEGEYKIITYGEFLEQINALGTKLIDMGLQGKKIAVIGENRYEWSLAYMAITCGTRTSSSNRQIVTSK
ncbi:MAG: hypothetical protein FWC79_00445 [Oscillospiraceae bacterium]|nr:hypothetical protein [Oscillospiraceae bacterium]